MSRWNAANATKAVLIGDRIISINGIQDDGVKMASTLKEEAAVSFRILRPGDKDKEVLEQKKAEKEVQKVLKVAGPPGLGAGLPEPKDSQVSILHARNIDLFMESQKTAIIMFYASWCGHCQEMAPEYTKAASLVKEAGLSLSSVRFAKFDAGDEANREYNAGSESKFNFTSFPTLVLWNGGQKEKAYGLHDAKEIAAYAIAKVNGWDVETEIQKALLETRPMMYRPDIDPAKVIDLEPETFDDMVLKQYEGNNHVWIIEYYSDKCPFCRSLKPEIIKAADEVMKQHPGQVRFAGVNSRVFNMLAKRFGVTSYPWIMSIYAGKKLEDMAGLGGAESVINWANGQFNKVWKKKPKWASELPPWPATDAPTAPSPSSSSPSIPDNSTGSWRELLGRRTWFYLHTVAAKFPEVPTDADRAAVQHLVASLGQHYPCPVCRQHLRAKLLDPSLGPVQTANRTVLSNWFCRLHNMVNKDLKKPIHNCNAFELDLQYLKSCGECSATPLIEAQPAEALPNWDFQEYLKASSSVKTEL